MAEKAGRPRVLVRRHVLEIKEDTQEFIEDLMDKWLAGKAIGATGEAVKGFLGNPSIGIWLIGALVAAMGLAVGKEGAEVIFDFFAKLEALHSKEGDKTTEADGFIRAQRALLEFFLPPGVPLP